MMNEQIRALIEQAGWTNAYTDPKDGFEPVFEGEDRNLACIEKFAELIVKECADIATNRYQRLMDGGKAIKQHFGVE
jgi:hypothetical protein